MYNEASVAEETLATVTYYAERVAAAADVLVVDDGSRDATASLVAQFIASRSDGRVRLVRHEVNRGYGGAMQTGLTEAVRGGYDYVLFMDSDLTNHPRYLAAFVAHMHAGADYIKATRYARGGRTEGVPWKRRAISIFGNVLARLAFRIPITDCTNGFRAARVAVLRDVVLTERGFAVILEELLHAKGHAQSFAEIPYTLTSRKPKARTSSFAYDWTTYAAYLRYVRSAMRTTRPRT